MLRHPFLVYTTVFVFLLSACGVDYQVRQNSMTEEQAMEALIEVPVVPGRNIRGRTSNLSATELQSILEGLVESGKIKVNTPRGATASGGIDLSMLNSIFQLLQSGQATSIFGLANGLLNLNGGLSNATGTGGTLDTILQILNAALPFIMAIAPQYAPIIQALVTIVPLVIQIIGMFSKKKTKTAALEFVPVFS